MVVKQALFLLLILFSNSIFSQQRYAVSFTDKNNSTYSVNNPQQFLSQKAIERRVRQGINIVEEDLPVNQNYINSVVAQGAILCNKSKWMNLIVVKVLDTNILASINNLPFVSGMTLIKSNNAQSIKNSRVSNKFFVETTNELDYGLASDQIKIMEGEFLHNKGYTGSGVTIAVIDAGYRNVNSISAFSHLRNENRLLGSWDFVNNNDSVFEDHRHGTMVLSTMAGVKSGEIIGTAPDANYWLLRSEDAATETISEEYNWMAAAEFADSVGADVINSSLGYTTFDDSTDNHTYADMDGITTVITRAADIAFSKGMLVVNSAGNSGGDLWYYIGAPADAFNVLSVGAVEHDGSHVRFSSHGPSFDGRIKPNVATIGSSSAMVDENGIVGYNSGTSFSSPEMAGMAASLWQAFPNKTNLEIKTAIEKSAHQYNSPDDEIGYGIPNFRIAYWDLAGIIVNDKSKSQILRLYPQPFKENFNLIYYSTKNQTIKVGVIDVTGKYIYDYNWSVEADRIATLNFRDYFKAAGIYHLRLIEENGNTITQKIIKQ